MGFYENAFRLIRECYAELKRDPATCRIADWRDAFTPDPFNGVMDWSPRGEWSPWTARMPPFEGLPGDAGNEVPRWTIADYLARSLELVRIPGAVRAGGRDRDGCPRLLPLRRERGIRRRSWSRCHASSSMGSSPRSPRRSRPWG